MTGGQRFWEIDLLRGFSVLLMIGFHLVYDLLTFNTGSGGLGRGPLLEQPVYVVWQRATAILFLLLAGVSLTLNGAAQQSRGPNCGSGYRRLMIRGVKILGWGLLITLATRLVIGRGYVVFGILHLIGLSILLSYPFLKQTYWNIGWGALAIGLGVYLNGREFSSPWMVWAGLVPSGFFSVDFFPFFPWFGFVLWGICLGNLWYGGDCRRRRNPDNPPALLGWLCFLGRNSLAIYLIHQPALLFILLLWRGGWKF